MTNFVHFKQKRIRQGQKVNKGMFGSLWSHLDYIKTPVQVTSYLYCWSRSHIIQDMCTDINHLQQVGEELLNHGH